MILNHKVGIIGGAGWLGNVIVEALINHQALDETCIGVSFRHQVPSEKRAIFKTRDNQQLAEWADVIILSVRPQDWPALNVDAKGKLVISIMAGVTIADISNSMMTKRVIRALPNVAAEVSQSYTPWTASSDILDMDREIASAIFDVCGVSDEVKSERDIDYLTGFSGSGPAYPALLADAMSRHAISQGINPDIAKRAAVQTMIGAGRLFERHQKQPAEIVKEFVDYKGVIAATIETMRTSGFETSITDGLEAGLNKCLAMQRRD